MITRAGCKSSRLPLRFPAFELKKENNETSAKFRDASNRHIFKNKIAIFKYGTCERAVGRFHKILYNLKLC